MEMAEVVDYSTRQEMLRVAPIQEVTEGQREVQDTQGHLMLAEVVEGPSEEQMAPKPVGQVAPAPIQLTFPGCLLCVLRQLFQINPH
jgi:hypothetical protein